MAIVNWLNDRFLEILLAHGAHDPFLESEDGEVTYGVRNHELATARLTPKRGNHGVALVKAERSDYEAQGWWGKSGHYAITLRTGDGQSNTIYGVARGILGLIEAINNEAVRLTEPRAPRGWDFVEGGAS